MTEITQITSNVQIYSNGTNYLVTCNYYIPENRGFLAYLNANGTSLEPVYLEKVHDEPDGGLLHCWSQKDYDQLREEIFGIHDPEEPARYDPIDIYLDTMGHDQEIEPGWGRIFDMDRFLRYFGLKSFAKEDFEDYFAWPEVEETDVSE